MTEASDKKTDELKEIPVAISAIFQQWIKSIHPLVEVFFAQPTKEWAASLTRPTINFFLFDLRENTERREVNPQVFRHQDEKTGERRMPPRRMDLSYLVSVFTADVSDEHALLWRVAATLMKFPELPNELLPKELQQASVPVLGRLSDKDSGRDFVEWWNGFGIPPRLALHYVLTVPLELDFALTAPLVLSKPETRYRQKKK